MILTSEKVMKYPGLIQKKKYEELRGGHPSFHVLTHGMIIFSDETVRFGSFLYMPGKLQLAEGWWKT